MNAYGQRVAAERLFRQAPDVRKTAKAILDELKSIETNLYWALDPEEKDGGAYCRQSLIDHAHVLLDCAHEYRAALKANPPPPEDDDAA